jgi:O-antigen ligase
MQLSFILVAVLLLITVVVKNERVNFLLSDLDKLVSNKYSEMSDDRIITWKASFRVISNNLLFGVGVGDVRNELVREYELMGAEKHIQQRLNAHNQFIEVILETGIPGILVFLMIYFYMIRIAISNSNTLYLLFILMTIVFFMFETTLYRLAGIAFFSLFAFLLIFNGDNQLQSKID